MKKHVLLGSMLLGLAMNNLWSQPIGYNTPFATNSTNVITTANAAWYRGGNGNSGPAGNANIFGTKWNSPIYTITDNQYRMKLNGTVNYPVNGFAGQRDGYLLLGATSNDNYSNANRGAASLLHLNGVYNSNFQPERGYRPWMQTGITMTDNDDLSYFGLRRIGYETDLTKSITETTICWSNDVPGDFGPDDMSFRFMGEGNLPTSTINNNLLDNNDLDGRHVARFSNDGLFGIGNTFGINGIGSLAGLYVRPQALLHLSYSNLQSIWSQYTNRDLSTGGIGTGGTGETATDGLRIGILGSVNTQANGTAAIYNQELKPILLSTNANSNTINPVTGATGERVRITSVNTPTNQPVGGIGIYNPGSIPNNITRMSVSHNPSNPVTRPLSLVHLGYNTSLLSTDGWRLWMDVGTFTSNGSDNMYVGLKDEGPDRQDAVINWGDNQGIMDTIDGPDNLRFIFTSTTTGFNPGDSVAASLNGLEVARMEPNLASTLPSSNFGMMGIGDFSPTGPNTANPVDAKLDIDGDLRIRNVTNDNNLTQVLVIDPTDKNRVHFRDAATLSGATSIGNYCSAPQNNLTGDFEVPLTGNYNYYFSGANTSSVGIGWACNSTLKAKIDVIDDTKGIAGNFNTYGTNYGTGQAVMAHAYASGIGNIGVQGYATSSGGPFNFGILGYANGTTNDRAGYFNGLVEATNISVNSDQQFKTNVTSISSALDIVKQLSPRNYYMDTNNFNQFNFESRKQFGFIAQELESVLPELVYQSYNPGVRDSSGAMIGQPLYYKSVNYNAIIPINTQAIKELNQRVDKATLSDATIKNNVQDLSGALQMILALRGVSFDWDQANNNDEELDSNNHIGFLAQEVQAIEPRLTFTGDNNRLHVDYNKVVPVLVEAFKEQNAIISHQDSMINELNNRLSNLENCINSLNLCNQNQPTQMAQPTTGQTITLNTIQSIVLNQNVPNPFAEQTVITFSLPENIQKVNIMFYDSNGKMINNVEIKERGNSQLNVFANDLSTGVYTYTLVADGQIVATKKMVKQ
jgi:hypothetical protein